MVILMSWESKAELLAQGGFRPSAGAAGSVCSFHFVLFCGTGDYWELNPEPSP